MKNFSVRKLCTVLRDLEHEEASAREASATGLRFGAGGEARERIQKLAEAVVMLAVETEMEAVIRRAGRFNNLLSKSMEWRDYEAELRTLRELIEGNLSGIHVYRYPKDKFRFYIEYGSAWQKALLSYPGIRPEIEAGVDCYALGYNTACIFHMMRVAEFGLRALAARLKVKTVRKKAPVELGTWNDVIRAINEALAVMQNAAVGPKKDAAWAFYNAALSDLTTLQGLYRDKTTQLRQSYDDGQARTAMSRVCALMNCLADTAPKPRPRRKE